LIGLFNMLYSIPHKQTYKHITAEFQDGFTGVRSGSGKVKTTKRIGNPQQRVSCRLAHVIAFKILTDKES